jgi:hypothetical protein
MNVILYFDIDGLFVPEDFNGLLFFFITVHHFFKMSHPFNNIAESDVKIYFFFLFTKKTLL